MTRTLLLFCLVAWSAVGQTIIPLDRVPVTNTLPWQVVGVQGGAVYYPNGIDVDAFGADPTGVIDSAPAINNAISMSALNTSVIFKVGGRYRINSPILVQNVNAIDLLFTNVTIDSHVSSGLNSIYLNGGGIGVTNAVSSGYLRGSTNLVLATTTGITPGCYAQLNESNNPAIVKGTLSGEYDHVQVFQVLSVSGNNITLDHPIYISYTAAYGPGLAALTAPVTNTSILGTLTLDCANSTAGDGIWIHRGVNCFIGNGVVVTNCNTTSTGFSLQNSYLCEVRQVTGPNNKTQASSSYGVQLVQCDRCLVIDSILENTSSGILFQVGTCGSVCAYNFDPGYWFTTVNCMVPGGSQHGDFANMNLVEGNVLAQYSIDNTHGNNPTNTLFRNWIMSNNYRTNFPTDCRSGYELAATNAGEVLIDCVLALPSDVGTSPGGSHNAYDLASDAAVASLFMHGNFDYFSDSTQYSNGISHTFPYSYFLPGYQSWMGSFNTNMIGSDVNTGNSITNGPIIPAMARYLGVPYLLNRLMRVTSLHVGTSYTGH